MRDIEANCANITLVSFCVYRSELVLAKVKHRGFVGESSPTEAENGVTLPFAEVGVSGLMKAWFSLIQRCSKSGYASSCLRNLAWSYSKGICC